MKQTLGEAVAVVGTALLLGNIVVAQQDPATASAPREIEVIAKRFAYEPARIEVNEGERIRLMTRGAKPVVIDVVDPAPRQL